jgi:hypothetical protein
MLAGCSVLERSAAPDRLCAQFARIRAAGEPLTFDELRGAQPADDGVDAASEYRAATELLARVDSGPIVDLLSAYRAGSQACPPVPPSAELRERARRMLEESQQALDSIDRAAATDACHYALDLDTAGLPRLAPFRRAGALLSLRTLERVFAGDADGAASSLISKLRMLRVFETEPMLLSYLVRLAEWSQAGLDLAAVLGVGALPRGSLDDLDSALRKAEAPDLLRRTLQGERVWTSNELFAILGPDCPDDAHVDGDVLLPSAERTRILRQADEYFAVTAAMIEAAGEPWPRVLDAMPAAFPESIPRGSPLPWTPIMIRAGQALAASRAGRVAIAVEHHRRERGELPAALTDLAVTLPVDPFTGLDFLYQRGEGEFVVASVGRAQEAGVRARDDRGHPQGVGVCLAPAAVPVPRLASERR